MLRKVKDILRLLEIPEQEIAVYGGLLELQKATIPELREHLGLPNITVYRSLKLLVDRGMVDREGVSKKQIVYRPLTPQKLIRAISNTQHKLRRIELELLKANKLLSSPASHSVLPDVEMRLGLDAFREEYLKLPDTFHDEYLHLGSAEKFWETAKFNYDSPEERGFINRRLSNNLYTRALDTPSSVSERIQRNDSREKRTMKLVPKLPVMNDLLMISDAKVVHFVNDRESPRVIIIRNPELVQSHRAHFATLWNQ
jgi:sugar-specific transcriptional regulator TrmB